MVIPFYSMITDFHSALAPTVELGTAWPPAGIDPLNPEH
jgi:hypothetical protein